MQIIQSSDTLKPFLPTQKKNYLALFSPEYRFGIKVELKDKVKPDYFLSASKERVLLKEGNTNVNSSIGIERSVFYAKTN